MNLSIGTWLKALAILAATFTLAIVVGMYMPVDAAQQTINVGVSANDGTGDPARSAFQKVNANFTDLYSVLYAPITGPVTIASGSNTSAIAANAVTNGMRALMPASTTKCNTSGSAGPESDCTVSQMLTLLGSSVGLTSVGLTVPSVFGTVGSPLTSNGSITLVFASGQTANQFLATPDGTTGAVGLRGILATDLPSKITPAAIVGGGTAFTVSGCGTAGTITGGSTVGTFTVGTGATPCTFTITMGGSVAATHGWACGAYDLTKNLPLAPTSTVSTTQCTVTSTVNGTSNAVATSDVIQFSARGY